jgi:hypothetical protein
LPFWHTPPQPCSDTHAAGPDFWDSSPGTHATGANSSIAASASRAAPRRLIVRLGFAVVAIGSPCL